MKNSLGENKNDMANGLIYLKGGDFQEELDKIPYKYKTYALHDLFQEEFFQTKKMVHIFKFQIPNSK